MVGRAISWVACACAASCLLVATPTPARARARISTQIDPCVPIDAERFKRLLDIELSAAFDYMADAQDTGQPVTIALSCADGGIQLLLEDAVTRKSMTRVVDVRRVEAQSRSRLMALTVAEFVVASWLELRLPKEAVAEPIGPAAPGDLERSVTRVVDERLASTSVPVWQLEAAFTAMVFESARSLIAGGEVRLSHVVAETFLFGVGLQLGHGHVPGKLAAQSVEIQITTTTLAASLLYLGRFGVFDATAGIGAKVGFAYLKGTENERAAPYSPEPDYAPWAGPMAILGLAYRPYLRLRIALEIEAGITVVQPSLNAVGSADPVASLDTGWGAGSVRVGWWF